jgi:hypothetical protein
VVTDTPTEIIRNVREVPPTSSGESPVSYLNLNE